MLKDFVWKAFEATGDIDAYMFFKEIDKREKPAKQKNISQGRVAINKWAPV